MADPTGRTRPPVLVVSIDGLAPRHITRNSMPALTTLALEGAACWTAQTVAPPWTLPAHTSMFRGVSPSRHGLLDNTPAPLTSDAPSFLRVASEHGLRTAMFVNWRPLDTVIERDATEHRFVIDGGYGPEDDRRSVDAAALALRADHHDLTFVYLSRPDVDGPEHGWDSSDYLQAVARADSLLTELIDAAGPDTSVVVTTDHGGLGNTHADEVPAVMNTFVVVRSADRVAPASGWRAASVLDIAPTVADLCGVAPHPSWEGGSLLGREEDLTQVVLDLLAATANESYGERVTMLDHALQSAALAASQDAGDEMVLACLLHDLGHVLGDAGQWGLPGHAEVGAQAMQATLAPAIVEPIRGHVEAKRYRVTVEPEYHDRLSLASQMSLQEQGGPLSVEEADAFAARPFATEAVRLREWDDDGKVDGLRIPPLESYRELVAGSLTATPPLDAAWARDACRCSECRDAGNDQHLIDATHLRGWSVIRTDAGSDALRVTVHHELTGERHVCQVPRRTADDLTTVHWDATHLTSLRAEATGWQDDHRPFIGQLASHGIALFRGCGVEPGTVLTVGNTVGHVRTTNYGALFDVIAEPDPVNLAYTPLALPVHTDNPYRNPCPTVQLLHCLAAAEDGGASRFVDGFAAAARLRAEDPGAFSLLAATDVTFRYHGDGADLRASRPIIELDGSGAVIAVSVNNRSMEPLAEGHAASASFYEAYRTFVDLLGRDGLAIKLTLQPGELVAFDNRRVLHGREAFHVTQRRHLQGCYIDMDAIRSAALTSCATT